jgi:hypothetical protein
MALSNAPVFAQSPKAAFAKVTSANTNLDGSGVVTSLLTAGADGAVVTALKALCQATVTATACRLFLSLDGGTTWGMIEEKLMSAYTVAQTTAQTPVTFVDKSNPDAAIRLPANAKLGVTIGVALAGGIVFNAEYTDN